ncbi:hypothetical protein [Tunturiibacter gelidiferens]|uniref:hypothetical protein n=1 Tax=Tunturiibacter gelidiferens TaxID=3069689 RepID=UPI003D9BC6BC
MSARLKVALAGLSLLIAGQLNFVRAQKSNILETSETLHKAEIVDGNLQTAITAHIKEDPHFHISKQLPEDKQNEAKMLFHKDGGFEFDWTAGQHARYLMEDLRQGIHALQSADKLRGLDTIALSGAREYWPKLRDISCHESPGTRYYDLDGMEQFCP